MGDGYAVVFGLVIAQHDFEFDEITEVFDGIHMNARLAGEIQLSHLDDAAGGTDGSGQRVTQRIGRVGRHDVVAGHARAGAVGAEVVDQITALGRELPQLQAPIRAGEEGVVLIDALRA